MFSNVCNNFFFNSFANRIRIYPIDEDRLSYLVEIVKLTNAKILNNIMGSDHCPIELDVDITTR